MNNKQMERQENKLNKLDIDVEVINRACEGLKCQVLQVNTYILVLKKSRIRESPNLSTNANSSTDTEKNIQ